MVRPIREKFTEHTIEFIYNTIYTFDENLLLLLFASRYILRLRIFGIYYVIYCNITNY